MAGTVLALADVGDPVFAGELLGPGFALRPDRAGVVVAPVDGVLVATRAHAFVVRAGDQDVLVHLGLDTHDGPGSVDLTIGGTVRAGSVVGRWDHDAVLASGRPALCPVVSLGSAPDAVTLLVRPGERVRAGDAVLHLRGDPLGPVAAQV